MTETIKHRQAKADNPRTELAPDAKKVGRPAKYSEAIAAEMIERLCAGEPLRQTCRDTRMPAWSKVYEWMVKNKDLSAAVVRARELGNDNINRRVDR